MDGDKTGDVKRGYFCGKCKKRYSKKQNWEEHFNAKFVKGVGATSATKGNIANICFNTSDPRICDQNLDLAVQKYQKEYQQRQSAKQLFSLFTKSKTNQPTTYFALAQPKNQPHSENPLLIEESSSLICSQNVQMSQLHLVPNLKINFFHIRN